MNADLLSSLSRACSEVIKTLFGSHPLQSEIAFSSEPKMPQRWISRRVTGSVEGHLMIGMSSGTAEKVGRLLKCTQEESVEILGSMVMQLAQEYAEAEGMQIRISEASPTIPDGLESTSQMLVLREIGNIEVRWSRASSDKQVA
jgi:CheY-specific phosphatase CheX